LAASSDWASHMCLGATGRDAGVAQPGRAIPEECARALFLGGPAGP
jgi:hypothetical protein